MLTLKQQIHFSKMYLLLNQKEKQVQKWFFTFPSPSIYLFFILFLTRYQVLDFIKKPSIYEVLKKSENPNAFFPNKGRCETPQAVHRSQPAIRFKCSYEQSRYRLRHFEHKSHGSKPCRPIHLSPTSLRVEWTDVWFSEGYTPVFFVRACAWVSAPENNTETISLYCGNALIQMDNVSKSPQE